MTQSGKIGKIPPVKCPRTRAAIRRHLRSHHGVHPLVRQMASDLSGGRMSIDPTDKKWPHEALRTGGDLKEAIKVTQQIITEAAASA